MVWLFLGIAGCGGDKDPITPIPTDTAVPTDTATEPTGDTGTPVPTESEFMVLDPNNYTLNATWSFTETEVREGWDCLASWSTMTTDAWGVPLVPVAVPKLVLLEVLMTKPELEAALARDELGTSLISVWEADVTGSAFASLSELSFGVTPFSPSAFLVESTTKTWLLALATSDGVRLDLRTGIVIVPKSAGGATSITLADGAATFTASAAFDGAPLILGSGGEGYRANWEKLVDDALGKPYDKSLGDVLFFGQFDGADPSTLGADVLALEPLASTWFTMDVAGDETALLELARDGSGTNFGGFPTPGEWLMGVTCTTCFSPFPLWVVVLDVR